MDSLIAELISNTVFLILYVVFGGMLAAWFLSWLVKSLEEIFNHYFKE